MTGRIEEEANEGALEGALESNVEQLMRRAPATPQMNPEARARTLQVLLAAQQAKTSEPAPRPAAQPSNVIALPRQRHRTREAMLLGAVAVAAGCLGLFMSSDVFRPTLVHENKGRGPMTISLLDGSKAVLDEGAKIEERGKRNVHVAHGGVIFDVAHGSGMRVDAGPARVTSLGTAFLVRAEEGKASVAVARGKVEVEGQGGDAVVLAGQQSIVSGNAAPETKPAPRLSHLFGFARKAEGEPLEEQTADAEAPRRNGTLIARDPRWGGERPLEIRDMTIDVHVEDGVARTTIDQTFFNADVRQLEGVYQLPLPQGAAISRLGMYVDGQLMEAAVVDRDRGRDIYEGIVYQRRDPALLEWMSGNSFKMRVFPLPGRTEKRIFLSYTQTLEHLYDTERLVVPIPPVDLPAQHVKLRVRVAGGSDVEVRSPSHDVAFTNEDGDRVGTFEASSYTLGDDFVISMRSGQAEEDMVRSFEEDGARPLRHQRFAHRRDAGSATQVRARARLGSRG
ncbi:MAG: hypothetical protein HOV80_16740 [Polyangiaceae bacterium]|nr:hypothetical protein [Polyangiaceae bacterium]